MARFCTIFWLYAIGYITTAWCFPLSFRDRASDEICPTRDPFTQTRGYDVKLKDNLRAIHFINSLPELRAVKPELDRIGDSSFSGFFTSLTVKALRCNPAVDTVQQNNRIPHNIKAWYTIELKGDVPVRDFVSSVPVLRAVRDSVVFIDNVNFNAHIRDDTARELESNPAVNVVSPVLFVG